MQQRYGYGYVRVSTDRQEELSPDSQERLLREYAQKNHIILLKIYFEIGISGRKADKRPQFQEMIASAKSDGHPADVILVWKYSRFARNQEESIVYKSLLKKQNNVDVISVSEPLVEGPFGSLIERIIEWMDEYYSIRLSGEVFRGMKENAARGAFQARPPLGYKITEHGKPPVIVPEEAPIIQMIFHKFANERTGLFDIARHLNSLGYVTSQGKPFERRSIEYIIQNPMYCGMIRWNRTSNDTNEVKDPSEWIIARGEHEPIITEELYEKAQAVLQEASRSHGSRQSRPSSACRHWLSGLLKCPDCGRTLAASTMRRRNGEIYSYFTCCGYTKGKCRKPNGVSSLVIEEEILKCLKEALHTGHMKEYELRRCNLDKTANERTLLQSRLHSLTEKESRIKASYREGIDTLEEYRENKALLQNERTLLHAQLAALDKKNKAQENPDAPLAKVHGVYEILTSGHYTTAQKNKALKQIVHKIIYNRSEDCVKIFYYATLE